MKVVDITLISGPTPMQWECRDLDTGRWLYVRHRGNWLTAHAGMPGWGPDEAVDGVEVLSVPLEAAADGRVDWARVEPLLEAITLPLAPLSVVLEIRKRCRFRVDPPGGEYRHEDAIGAFVEITRESNGDRVRTYYLEADAAGRAVCRLGGDCRLDDALEMAAWGSKWAEWREQTAALVAADLDGCPLCGTRTQDHDG